MSKGVDIEVAIQVMGGMHPRNDVDLQNPAVSSASSPR